jgi:hypothetical protein
MARVNSAEKFPRPFVNAVVSSTHTVRVVQTTSPTPLISSTRAVGTAAAICPWLRTLRTVGAHQSAAGKTAHTTQQPLQPLRPMRGPCCAWTTLVVMKCSRPATAELPDTTEQRRRRRGDPKTRPVLICVGRAVSCCHVVRTCVPGWTATKGRVTFLWWFSLAPAGYSATAKAHSNATSRQVSHRQQIPTANSRQGADCFSGGATVLGGAHWRRPQIWARGAPVTAQTRPRRPGRRPRACWRQRPLAAASGRPSRPGPCP